MASGAPFPIISKHPASIHRSSNCQTQQGSTPASLESTPRPVLYASTRTTNNYIGADSRFIRKGFDSTDSLDWAFYKLQMSSMPANLDAKHRQQWSLAQQRHSTASYYHCPTRNADVEIARSLNSQTQYQQAVRSALQTPEATSALSSPVFSYHSASDAITRPSSLLHFATSVETTLQSTVAFVPDIVQPATNVRDLPNALPNPRWQTISLNRTRAAAAVALDYSVWSWNFTSGDNGVRKVGSRLLASILKPS
jgi:hypothetical protein